MTEERNTIDQFAKAIAVELSGYRPRTATKRQIRKPCRCNCHNFDWEGYCDYCGCDSV